MGEAHWPTLEISHGRERWAEVILVTLGQKYVRAILRFSKFSSLCWESGESPNGSTSVSPGPGLGGCHRARPLSIPAGHVASARNKPLLFKALRLGFFFVTVKKPSPSWVIKLGPETWNTIPGTAFAGDLNLRAQFWRSSVAQKQIKEAKTNSFSLFPQQDNSGGFPNLTPKRQQRFSTFTRVTDVSSQVSAGSWQLLQWDVQNN